MNESFLNSFVVAIKSSHASLLVSRRLRESHHWRHSHALFIASLPYFTFLRIFASFGDSNNIEFRYSLHISIKHHFYCMNLYETNMVNTSLLQIKSDAFHNSPKTFFYENHINTQVSKAVKISVDFFQRSF